MVKTTVTLTLTLTTNSEDIEMVVCSYDYNEQFLVLTEYLTEQNERRVHLIPISKVGYVLVSIKPTEQPA